MKMENGQISIYIQCLTGVGPKVVMVSGFIFKYWIQIVRIVTMKQKI